MLSSSSRREELWRTEATLKTVAPRGWFRDKIWRPTTEPWPLTARGWWGRWRCWRGSGTCTRGSWTSTSDITLSATCHVSSTHVQKILLPVWRLNTWNLRQTTTTTWSPACNNNSNNNPVWSLPQLQAYNTRVSDTSRRSGPVDTLVLVLTTTLDTTITNIDTRLVS